MSELEYTAILNAIETIRTANCKSHDDIRELLREGLEGVHRDINATAFVTNARIDALTKRMDTNNGNVAKLQDESLKRAEVVRDFRRLEATIAAGRKKWPWYLGGAVLLIIIVLVTYDTIGLRGIIELMPLR